MGSQGSKLEEPYDTTPHESLTNINESVASTPILTPVDPRSPSTNIARTPLDVIFKSNDLEDSISTAVLGIDPRSPTVEFTRTPIVIGTTKKQKTSKLVNKNLDNVRKTLIQTTPTKSTAVPPKLLHSSPIQAAIASNKRRSSVGLLETNIDYTETDLDVVEQAKYALNRTMPSEVTEDCVTPLTNKLKTQMNALKLHANVILDLHDQDTDDVVVVQEEKAEETNVVPVVIEEEKSVVPIEENTIDVVEVNEESVVPEIEQVENPKTPEEKTINITAHVKDFDKKLTNLIYEDDIVDSVVLKSAKVKDGVRTPLVDKNQNGERRQTLGKLKVSDRPRKIEISKIPVFKDNFGKNVVVQCENTPPRKMGDSKVKSKPSHWDADKTLFI